MKTISLPWDTDLFGFPVVQLQSDITPFELPDLLSQLKKENVVLVYLFVEPINEALIRASLKSQGTLVDKKVSYKTNALSFSANDPHIVSYLNRPLSQRLISLAIQSGQHSRYKRDGNFTQEQFERLYTAWIENSLKGEIAQEVLVYTEEEKELGILTLKDEKNTCSIGLLAVDAEVRGKGIGSKLLNAAFAKAHEWGYNEVSVTTQEDNIPACKLYEKVGFIRQNVQYVYHFWLKDI